MDAIIDNLRAERATLLAVIGKIDAALAALTGAGTKAEPAAATDTGAAPRRRRRKMTDEQKRAISARMKKSWASRKRKAARQ
ncbi:MAG: hypothetical protein O3A25_12245 [Acidobacteria bacterium]|nr:hypothetical protein [Acidobacteriota bacterium]